MTRSRAEPLGRVTTMTSTVKQKTRINWQRQIGDSGDVKETQDIAQQEVTSDQPSNHSLQVKSNLMMKCEWKVVDSINPHVITWYKHCTVNGAWDGNNGSVYVYELQTTASHIGDDSKLLLTNITQEDAGWYSCTVKNQFGACVSYGHLYVTLPDPDPHFSSFYIYLSVSIALGFFIVVLITCPKYKREKKLK